MPSEKTMKRLLNFIEYPTVLNKNLYTNPKKL